MLCDNRFIAVIICYNANLYIINQIDIFIYYHAEAYAHWQVIIWLNSECFLLFSWTFEYMTRIFGTYYDYYGINAQTELYDFAPTRQKYIYTIIFWLRRLWCLQYTQLLNSFIYIDMLLVTGNQERDGWNEIMTCNINPKELKEQLA